MPKQMFSAFSVAITLFLIAPVLNAVEVTPSDVFSEVSKLSQEIDQVRFHMGAPKVAPLDLKVQNAQPHDVYFLARTLFQKSSRLLFQVNRKSVSISDTSSGVYLPADVLSMISAARTNVTNVMDSLGVVVSKETMEERAFTGKEASDVLFLFLQLIVRSTCFLTDDLLPVMSLKR